MWKEKSNSMAGLAHCNYNIRSITMILHVTIVSRGIQDGSYYSFIQCICAHFVAYQTLVHLLHLYPLLRGS